MASSTRVLWILGALLSLAIAANGAAAAAAAVSDGEPDSAPCGDMNMPHDRDCCEQPVCDCKCFAPNIPLIMNAESLRQTRPSVELVTFTRLPRPSGALHPPFRPPA